MTEQYYKDLYEWLQSAYESAMQLADPKLALEYLTLMRAMEVAGVVKIEKPTVH